MPLLSDPAGGVEAMGQAAMASATLVARGKPLLQMTPDELVQAYMMPLSVGLYLSLLLYGMFALSVYMYCVHFSRDTWMNRAIVALLACFCTADTVAGATRVYRMTVLYPNNLTYVLDVTQRPEDWICTLMLFCTILLSQLFMCARIITFARAMREWSGARAQLKIWLITGSLSFMWFVCLAVGVANSVIFYRVTNYMQLLLPADPLSYAFRISSLLMPCVFLIMDLLIAVYMTMQYRKARTGFGVSNHILETLVSVVIRNGILVASIMVIQFIVTLTAVLWGNMLPMCYGKLHALTVLCILTEPRMAQSAWHKTYGTGSPRLGAPEKAAGSPAGRDPRGAGAGGTPSSGSAWPGGIKTPYMDYTRPSQFGQSVSYRGRSRSMGSLRDGLGLPGRLPYDEESIPGQIAGLGGDGGRKMMRPIMVSRQVSEPTSNSNETSDSTALNTETPPSGKEAYEYQGGVDRLAGLRVGREIAGRDGLVVNLVGGGESEGELSFKEALAGLEDESPTSSKHSGSRR